MRGVYTATYDITGLSTAKTVVLIQAPATAVVEILSVSFSQKSSTTSDEFDVGLFLVSTYGSPTGTSLTPAKHENGDQASGCTVLVNLTVEPTSYQTVAIDKQGINSLAGYRYDPIPEERPVVPPSGAIGLKLGKNPSVAIDTVVQVVYREIG